MNGVNSILYSVGEQRTKNWKKKSRMKYRGVKRWKTEYETYRHVEKI